MRTLVALAALGLLSGACGGGGGAGETGEGAGERRTSITQQEIEQVLLGVEDVPAGYTASPPEGGAADLVICRGIAELREAVAQDVSARARFTGPDLMSTIGQEAYFDPAATHGVARLRRIFDECDQVTTTVQGRSVTLDVSERPFASYGDESAAFRVSGSVMGVPFGADFAAVSLGGVVSLVYAAGVGADHAEELERLVEVTYAKQDRVTRP